MKCIKCKKVGVKAGYVLGKQRYKCKGCNYHYTQEHRGKKPERIKQLACILYLQGLGFRRIGAILNVSFTSVIRWVRQYEEVLKKLPREVTPRHCRVIEIDEMWHFTLKKNEKSGFGLLWIETQEKSLPTRWVVVE